MNVFNKIEDIEISSNTCITIGNFDGVHKGHQTLMKKAVEYSKKNNLKSVVFTFSNHPVNFFKPGYVKNIISSKEKENIIKELGVDIYVNIEFNRDMTEISAEDYIKNILIGKLNAKKIIVGHDFSFARRKEGNPEILEKYGKIFGFDVEVVMPVLLEGKRISSTDIRNFIANGDVISADNLLGRYYAVEGEVVKARQIGRTIGFPTANIKYDKSMIIPQNGIYATLAIIKDRVYCGATSVGTNPTVQGRGITIETFILDFDEMIYGENLRIEFVERMRSEIKFDSKEDLRQQLIKDESYVRNNYVKCLNACMESCHDFNTRVDALRKIVKVQKY